MHNLAPSEIILITAVMLVVLGAAVTLAVFGVKKLSAGASWPFGRRSTRSFDAKSTEELRDGDDTEQSLQDHSVRASDADRERTIEKIREETTQGRLTLSEFEERMEIAQYAKTLGDLAQLVQDLPSGKS